MSKLKQIKLRYLAVAMAFCLISVMGMSVCKNILAAPAVPAVTFNAATDTLTAKYGTAPYYFYTTAKVTAPVDKPDGSLKSAAKIPAANNWVRTENGAVDVSNFTKGKTLYFANSTTPAYEDIIAVTIPATPTLSGATYKAGEATLNEKFVFQTKIKVTTTTAEGKTTTKVQAVTVPNTRIEIKVNDNSTWKPFATAITDATLSGLQKEGATIYARIAPSDKVTIASADGGKTYTFTDAGTAKITSTEEGKVYDSESITRYGAAKTLKITKKSVGPAIAIDYANHCMTIKNTQSYGKSTAAYASPATWTELAAEKKTDKIYFGDKGTVKADEQYGIKTKGTAKAAESLVTYMVIPPTKAFADTNSTVTIQGGFGEAATMVISNNSDAKASVAYQYAIVDLTDTEKYANLITSTGIFDYSNTNVKWTAAKTNKDGVAKVALKWAAVNGKQVIVRKAAVGKEYSSAVEILNAPTGKELATYSTAATMPAVNCWTKLAQAKYTTGFVGKNTNMEFCANIDAPVYDVATKKITFNVIAGKTVSAPTGITVKIGKKIYDVSSAVTGAAANKKATIASKTYTAYNYKVTIDLTKIPDFPVSDANAIAITVPEGYGANTANLATVAKALSITVDNKAPVVKSVKCTPESKTNLMAGNVVITLDSKLSLSGTALDNGAKIAVANITSSNAKVMTFAEGTYAYNTKAKVATITVPYTVVNSGTEKVTLTLKNLTDIAGNNLSNPVCDITNPAYTG